MKKKSKHPSFDQQNKAQQRVILHSMLSQVLFDGWTDSALSHALRLTGTTPGEFDLLFPEGIRDLIEFFGSCADQAVLKRIEDEPGFARFKIREKITFAVRARLEFWSPHREAVRRMMYWYALPFHLPLGVKRLYKSVDLMWRASGDQSTDFNFYTKRALLTAVLKTTILFWLDDETPGSSATWAFLDRRISEVLKIGKSISLLKEWTPSELVDIVKRKLKRA